VDGQPRFDGVCHSSRHPTPRGKPGRPARARNSVRAW
jgi:hypothetical protein